MSAAHEEIIRILLNVAPRKLKSAELYDAGEFENTQILAMALHDMAGTVLTRDGERGKFQYGIIPGVDPHQWLRNRKTRAKADPARAPGPVVRVVHNVQDLRASAAPAKTQQATTERAAASATPQPGSAPTRANEGSIPSGSAPKSQPAAEPASQRQGATGEGGQSAPSPVKATDSERATCPDCGGPMTRHSVICAQCWRKSSPERKAELGLTKPRGTHATAAANKRPAAPAGVNIDAVHKAPARAIVPGTASATLAELLTGARGDLIECAEAHSDPHIKALARRVRLIEELQDSFRSMPA